MQVLGVWLWGCLVVEGPTRQAGPGGSLGLSSGWGLTATGPRWVSVPRKGVGRAGCPGWPSLGRRGPGLGGESGRAPERLEDTGRSHSRGKGGL